MVKILDALKRIIVGIILIVAAFGVIAAGAGIAMVGEWAWRDPNARWCIKALATVAVFLATAYIFGWMVLAPSEREEDASDGFHPFDEG